MRNAFTKESGAMVALEYFENEAEVEESGLVPVPIYLIVDNPKQIEPSIHPVFYGSREDACNAARKDCYPEPAPIEELYPTERMFYPANCTDHLGPFRAVMRAFVPMEEAYLQRLLDTWRAS